MKLSILYTKSKRRSLPTRLRQVFGMSGVFLILAILTPADVSARPVAIEPEITVFNTVAKTEEELALADTIKVEAAQKVERVKSQLEEVDNEAKKVEKTKLTLEEQIKQAKAELAELKRKVEEKKKREAEAVQRAQAIRAQQANIVQPQTIQQPVQRVTMANTAGNTYFWGQCTWYVKNMRSDLPNTLGNGGSWVANAAAQGYATGSTPRAGAVAEIPGHVMYVQSVNSNGTINISEMNYNGAVGVVNYRTIPASSAYYIY